MNVLFGGPQWSWCCSKALDPAGCWLADEQVELKAVEPNSAASGKLVRSNIRDVQVYVSRERHRTLFQVQLKDKKGTEGEKHKKTQGQEKAESLPLI